MMTNIKLVKKNKANWAVMNNGKKIGVATKYTRGIYTYGAIVTGGNVIKGDTQKELKENIAAYLESLEVVEETVEEVVEEVTVQQSAPEEKRFEFQSPLHEDVTYKVRVWESRYGRTFHIDVHVKGVPYIAFRKYGKRYHEADAETVLRIWDEEDFLYRERLIDREGNQMEFDKFGKRTLKRKAI